MKLSEIAIVTVHGHRLRKEWNIQAWCVQEHYWSHLKKYDTGQFRKVVIQVDDSLENESKDIGWIHINVLDIKRYLDIESFLNQDKLRRKQMLLDILHIDMLEAADVFNWDKEPLNNAYEQCKLAQHEYRFKVKGKVFRSPTREFTAYVDCYWDADLFSVKAIILNKQQEIVKEQMLLEMEPYWGEFIYYANCKWESNTSFSLIAKGERKWTTSLLSLV